MTKRRSRPIHMDTKLGDHVPAHYMNTMETPDLFGVEIELEGKKVITEEPFVTKFWAQHHDGSLRSAKNGPQYDQCIEYVFKHPLTRDETVEALTSLLTYLKSPGVKVFDSYRTSIHVHVNCMAETFRTIVNFITLSIIFDELFVSQNGQYRIGNNFTLRTRDAEGQLNDLIYSITNYANPFSGINAHHRYSSVNIASLGKFGTMEFRSLECTTDLERVIHWVDTCQALKVAARTYRDPRDIIETFSRKDSTDFIKFNLGDQAAKYLAVPDRIDMLHTGMRLAQDFAFCSEWIAPNAADLKEAEAQLKRLRKSPQKLGNWAAQAAVLNQYIAAGNPAGFNPAHVIQFDEVEIGGAPPPMGNNYWDVAAQPAPEIAPAEPYMPDDDDDDDHFEPEDDDDDF